MSKRTSIEWTSSTWNPVTGCSKISDGCANCYANRMALRLRGMGVQKYKNGFDVTIHPDVLDVPKKLKHPQIIFVNSMGDLFHEKVPESFIKDVFRTMTNCPQHIFQVLTKRSKRLSQLQSKLEWSNNIWMGVTVENAHFTYRMEHLRETGAFIRWLSCEPLLGPLNRMNLTDIDWIVVGGESGPGARPVRKDWILDIRDQCRLAGTSFFFKQWGGVNKKRTGRLLDRKIYDEMPNCPQFEAGQVSLF